MQEGYTRCVFSIVILNVSCPFIQVYAATGCCCSMLMMCYIPDSWEKGKADFTLLEFEEKHYAKNSRDYIIDCFFSLDVVARYD